MKEYLGDNTPSCMGSVTTGEMISTGMEMNNEAIIKEINDNLNPKKCFVGTMAIDPENSTRTYLYTLYGKITNNKKGNRRKWKNVIIGIYPLIRHLKWKPLC